MDEETQISPTPEESQKNVADKNEAEKIKVLAAVAGNSPSSVPSQN
ncbi:hypothetical protein [Pseudomonas syringae group genomosp. 3]|nr:hypothetical protein [Pseudomonas syringae group genomosp. 3]